MEPPADKPRKSVTNDKLREMVQKSTSKPAATRTGTIQAVSQDKFQDVINALKSTGEWMDEEMIAAKTQEMGRGRILLKDWLLYLPGTVPLSEPIPFPRALLELCPRYDSQGKIVFSEADRKYKFDHTYRFTCEDDVLQAVRRKCEMAYEGKSDSTGIRGSEVESGLEKGTGLTAERLISNLAISSVHIITSGSGIDDDKTVRITIPPDFPWSDTVLTELESAFGALGPHTVRVEKRERSVVEVAFASFEAARSAREMGSVALAGVRLPLEKGKRYTQGLSKYQVLYARDLELENEFGTLGDDLQSKLMQIQAPPPLELQNVMKRDPELNAYIIKECKDSLGKRATELHMAALLAQQERKKRFRHRNENNHITEVDYTQPYNPLSQAALKPIPEEFLDWGRVNEITIFTSAAAQAQERRRVEAERDARKGKAPKPNPPPEEPAKGTKRRQGEAPAKRKKTSS